MEVIQKELDLIKVKVKDFKGVDLISCVPAMVRFKITRTAYKTLDACFMFPDEYPRSLIVIELKSKVLDDKLLQGLSTMCEVETKRLQGQKQILHMVQFIRKFIDDNPLCVCSNEIRQLKRNLLRGEDAIKLKQKSSQVVLKLKEGAYYLNTVITVPEYYPEERLIIEIRDQNFPEMFRVNIVAQAVEIARQCVEPPLKKNIKAPPFQPKRALVPVCEFLVKEVVHTLPKEICPCCHLEAFPADPVNIVNDESSPKFVERMYCRHLFHYECLDKYMKIPPFTGGKTCPTCGNRIFHDKWKITPALAEARWAHKEARQRELSEIVDFLE